MDKVMVPCNGCTACCKREVVALLPEYGDDPTQYDCHPVKVKESGETRMVLRQRPNGECVYLGPQGCTIYERAPLVCQNFDCRVYYLMLTRHERRLTISKGAGAINNKAEIYKAARARLGSATAETMTMAASVRKGLKTIDEELADEHNFAARVVKAREEAG
jgi:Fe-S-cluster containining protein